MVLKRHWVWVLWSAAACIPHASVQKLAEPAPLAMAWVRDPQGGQGVFAVSEAAVRPTVEAAAQRNLSARAVPFEQLSAGFDTVRDSQRRLAQLRVVSAEAPFLLLVETRVAFFSELAGRYRWTVYVKLIAGARGDEKPVEDAFDVPVFLDYAREREDEALEAAAGTIADRVGLLFDSFIRAQAAPPAPRAARPAGDAVYFVMVDRFANGDPSNDGAIDPSDPAAFHGGDLAGVQGRLDWLQQLGVGTVWLSPLSRMRTEKFFGHGAFHGYWVEDLRELEPRFGDRRLLRRLSDDLHRRGMRLVLDLVLNHVAPDAPLSREKPEWFHQKGSLTDWNDREQLETRDVHGLPDLAQERDDVYRYLLDSTLLWVEQARPDGFRLDAVKHMPRAFWGRFNKELRARAGRPLWLLGEDLNGDPAAVATTQREGGFDAMFDFPLGFAIKDVFCKDRPVVRLGAVLTSDRLYDDPASLVTLVDNHDLPRVMTECQGQANRVEQALTFLLTARGTPSLTWGTEVGLSGAAEPENRGDMRFADGPLRAHVARLLGWRRAHEALSRGVPALVRVDREVLACERVADGEAALVVVNRGDQPAQLEWGRAPSVADLFSGAQVGARAIQIAPRSTFVGVAKGDFRAARRQLDAQWRKGHKLRQVEFDLPPGTKVAGSGPELGGWSPARSVVRAALPVGGAFELKRVDLGGKEPAFEQGENRTLFVPDGPGVLRVMVH